MLDLRDQFRYLYLRLNIVLYFSYKKTFLAKIEDKCNYQKVLRGDIITNSGLNTYSSRPRTIFISSRTRTIYILKVGDFTINS